MKISEVSIKALEVYTRVLKMVEIYPPKIA